MRSAREMDKLATVFLIGGTDARFYATDLRRDTGLSNARMLPLLQEMKQQGWIAQEWPESDPARARCVYALTEHGREELSDD
ncbi:PadR family transcriptional regulator [Amycolatopsis sp. VC5-11]|uniref:PadR family transcriptional regulator n=1 Tax=Amycolatopsis sp. VC5-11 TaxID=3120156 RepID=UPI003009626C